MTKSVLPGDGVPLSFCVCVSNPEILRANLLASPCLGPGSVHEVFAFPDRASAADGLNAGFDRAQHEWLICVHQDVYLPDQWDQHLVRQLREAERQFGPVGVAGVYGARDVNAPLDYRQPLVAERIGWVVDRGRELRNGLELPIRAATLDELLLVVRRDSGLRFDPDLGFHFYGADLCLQARDRGLAVVVLAVLCHHNSKTVELPTAFFASAAIFARKWSHRLPIATSCVLIDGSGRIV
jgi:Glycosyltransferase like family